MRRNLGENDDDDYWVNITNIIVEPCLNPHCKLTHPEICDECGRTYGPSCNDLRNHLPESMFKNVTKNPILLSR